MADKKDPVIKKQKRGFECQYCYKTFQVETSYMKHECKEKLRYDSLTSVQGMAAYQLYKMWLTTQGKATPSPETFLSSRYYNAFMNFADFIKKYRIPEPVRFIELMNSSGGMSPMLWCRDENYSVYLEWYDKMTSPIDQAENSIKELYKIMELRNLGNVSDVVEQLNHREIVEYVRLRKISPWILLCSKKFKDKLSTLPKDERIQIGNIIGLVHYADKFEKNPDIVTQMKEITSALGI